MKQAILIIIAIFVLTILYFVFSGDSMDDIRKKKSEKAGLKLVHKIEEANKKSKGGFTAYSGEGGRGGINNPRATTNPVQQSAPATNFSNGPNPFMNANPYVKSPNVQSGSGQPQNYQNAPRDNYYPPPPKGTPMGAQRLGPQSSMKDILRRNDPNFTTDDGHSVAYWGTKVYTLDEQGEPKPMPDGKYPMYGGKYTMVIRGGEQTIANDDKGTWVGH